MAIRFRLISALAVVAFSTVGAYSEPAAASETERELVTELHVNGTQHVIVNMTNRITFGRPTCHNAAWSSHFIFDASTAKGKAMLSVLTAALLAGRTISVIGGTTCITQTISGVGSVSIEQLTGVRLF